MICINNMSQGYKMKNSTTHIHTHLYIDFIYMAKTRALTTTSSSSPTPSHQHKHYNDRCQHQRCHSHRRDRVADGDGDNRNLGNDPSDDDADVVKQVVMTLTRRGLSVTQDRFKYRVCDLDYVGQPRSCNVVVRFARCSACEKNKPYNQRGLSLNSCPTSV